MPTLSILVLGATGPTGRCVVEQAVAAGLRVTALVRSPERLPPGVPLARLVTGDLASNPGVLQHAVQGQDAVISALGVGQSFTSRHLITRVAPAIVEAMRVHGVRRLVFTSAFGVGVTRRDLPMLPRLFGATLLRDIYADKEAGERIIEASDLAWTIVHPVMLTDGPPTGRYRVDERLALRGFPRIARADVAGFLLSQTSDAAHVRKHVLIAP